MKTTVTATAALVAALSLPQLSLAERHTLTMNIQQVTSWVRNFNPYNETTRLRSTREFIYEPLAIYNVFEQGQPYYRLAVAEAYSDDLMTFTYDLREGVQWSDGRPFTAADVVFTFEMLKQNPALDTGAIWNRLEAVEAEGDHRVHFHLSEVNTGIHLRLVDVPVVPEHIWSSVSDPVSFTNDNPVGTGPFTEIERFTPQIYVQCANPSYWDAQAVQIDCLRFPQLATNDNTLAAAASGELDWFGSFIPDIDRTYVSRNPQHHKYWLPAGSMVAMIMNLETEHEGNREAFNDVNFRRAYSMAMDRAAQVNIAGYGYPTLNDYASGLGELYAAWADAELREQYLPFMSYDLDSARELLLNAGYQQNSNGFLSTPSGNSIEFDIIVPNGWTDWVNTVQIAAEGLQEIGINARVRTPEAAVWDQSLINGNYDSAINSWLPGATPHRMLDNAFHSRFKDNTRFAAARYHNDELDALLDQFFTITSLPEQQSIIHKIEAIIAEDMAYVPVFNNPMWYQYNDSRFVGWWSEDNPKGRPQPHAGNPERLLHLLDLSPRQ
ncbi:MAG: ABC transporter substrate-binding protein [Saccharospirillum sp.]|nr:ABC transporter substrate-binding protein [Saccharospirillum sp.]